MGKTTAQKGAHVVKDGIRHKDVYATAVGDTTKAYLNKIINVKSAFFFVGSFLHFWGFGLGGFKRRPKKHYKILGTILAYFI